MGKYAIRIYETKKLFMGHSMEEEEEEESYKTKFSRLYRRIKIPKRNFFKYRSGRNTKKRRGINVMKDRIIKDDLKMEIRKETLEYDEIINEKTEEKKEVKKKKKIRKINIRNEEEEEKEEVNFNENVEENVIEIKCDEKSVRTKKKHKNRSKVGQKNRRQKIVKEIKINNILNKLNSVLNNNELKFIGGIKTKLTYDFPPILLNDFFYESSKNENELCPICYEPLAEYEYGMEGSAMKICCRYVI